MAGLIDLDELALRCRHDQAKAYIQEAVACYKGGAFRSSIVATWNAVVFDFLDKLRELELTGDNNAKKKIEDFEKIRTGGEAKLKEALEFERNVLSMAEKEFELFTASEKLDLARLQEDRNRCAHPSMQSPEDPYQPTAELARAHLRNAIEFMLERPPVQGKAALDRLFTEVKSEYFPTSTDDAVKIFGSGPLARPRDVLIRNFVIALLKTILKDKLGEKPFSQRVAALGAVVAMHRQAAEKILSEQLTGMTLSLDDPCLGYAVRLIAGIGSLTQLLGDDAKTKLRHYAAAMPTDDLPLILPYAIRIGFLESSAGERIGKLTSTQIAVVLALGMVDVPRALVERVISLYENAFSFGSANDLGKLLQRLAPDLTSNDMYRVCGAAKNPEVAGSYELSSVLLALRRQERIAPKKWNELIQQYALDKTCLGCGLLYELESPPVLPNDRSEDKLLE